MSKIDKDSEYSLLINRYKDLAFSIALKITGDEQDSEEIVQDSFIKAFNALNHFKHESQFSTWFYRIVYNTAISSIRKRCIQSVEINDKMIDHYENNQVESIYLNLDDIDRKKLVKDAMSKISESDYTVLSLFYYENLSLKEISKIVKKDPNYLKVVLRRARIKLYKALGTSSKIELKELL